MNRPIIEIIAAVDANFAIGFRGDLLFHISDDLKRFKALTLGHPIIMGRKTFESFPKGPLPGRRNIVVTRQPDYTRDGIETAGAIGSAIDLCSGAERVFIIGGGQLYNDALQLADIVLLTEILTNAPEADTYFPTLDESLWHIEDKSDTFTDAKSGVKYRFVTYRR